MNCKQQEEKKEQEYEYMPEDGYEDGGVPYSEEELDIINKDVTNYIPRIKKGN